MKLKFPGFKIIDRYITRQFLGTFFFAIMLFIVILVTFDAVEKIDDFIEMKAPLNKIILDYYVNFIPSFINMFSGLFTFISVIFFTSKMAGRTEITAIQSSGVSFHRMLWPYFISATVIMCFSLVLNLEIIPSANEHRVQFESQYLRKGRHMRYDAHIFRQVEPGVFAYIRSYNGNSQSASYFVLERYEGTSIVGSLEAAEVKYNSENGHWTAPKYITHTYEGVNDLFVRHDQPLDTLINLSQQELGKVENLITTLRISELNTFIEAQKIKGSDRIALFEVERQKRYSYPVSVLILTVIGVSLSSRKQRRGTGMNIGVGVVLCFTYIMLGRIFEEVAKNSLSFMSILLVWLPNIVFAVVAVFIYRKAPK